MCKREYQLMCYSKTRIVIQIIPNRVLTEHWLLSLSVGHRPLWSSITITLSPPAVWCSTKRGCDILGSYICSLCRLANRVLPRTLLSLQLCLDMLDILSAVLEWYLAMLRLASVFTIYLSRLRIVPCRHNQRINFGLVESLRTSRLYVV